MRKCSLCNNNKPLSDFYNERRGYCKECHSSYYQNYHKQRKEWINELKSKPCTDCGGVFHPAVMQFDHLPEKGKKRFNISRAISTAKKKADIEEELKKCELVCANCHSMRTFKRLNS